MEHSKTKPASMHALMVHAAKQSQENEAKHSTTPNATASATNAPINGAQPRNALWNAHATPIAPKRHAMVMVDGEFTGPNFHKHAVVAWALVVFSVVYGEASAAAAKAAAMGSSLPPDVHRAWIVGQLELRIRPESHHVMDPATFNGFWNKPEHRHLVEWVQGAPKKHSPSQAASSSTTSTTTTPSDHSLSSLKATSLPFTHAAHTTGTNMQGVLSSSEAAKQINTFLSIIGRNYHLRFISKPGSIDIPRLQHFLQRNSTIPFTIHHSSTCLLTIQKTVTQLMGMTYHDMQHLVQLHRRQKQRHATPTHYPLDDCLDQICDYVLFRNIIHAQRNALQAYWRQWHPCIPLHGSQRPFRRTKP